MMFCHLASRESHWATCHFSSGNCLERTSLYRVLWRRFSRLVSG